MCALRRRITGRDQPVVPEAVVDKDVPLLYHPVFITVSVKTWIRVPIKARAVRLSTRGNDSSRLVVCANDDARGMAAINEAVCAGRESVFAVGIRTIKIACVGG